MADLHSAILLAISHVASLQEYLVDLQTQSFSNVEEREDNATRLRRTMEFVDAEIQDLIRLLRQQ